MMLTAIRVFCCVLLCAATISAQARKSAADPVTGTWTGAPDDGAKLVLKFDGKARVSGTVGTPNGDYAIQAGTFDRKSGALKIQGEAKNREGALQKYLIEGKIAKDMVEGTYKFGDQQGTFKMTRTQDGGGSKRIP
jgi:hypothetical protein